MGVLDALVCAGAARIVESFALAVCKQVSMSSSRRHMTGRLTFNDHGRHVGVLFRRGLPCRQRSACHTQPDKAVLTKFLEWTD